MEQLLYKTNMVFNIDFDYRNSTIKMNNSLDPIDFIFMHTDYNTFMKYNPPCKDCLVCNMCIKENNNISSVYCSEPYLYIKICDKLKDFIDRSELFGLQG